MGKRKAAVAEPLSTDLDQVRDLVNRAASILNGFGPEYQKVGWMLEDALSYLSPEELKFSSDEPFMEQPPRAGLARQ